MVSRQQIAEVMAVGITLEPYVVSFNLYYTYISTPSEVGRKVAYLHYTYKQNVVNNVAFQ